MRKNKQAGFTLTEMMVVIAIVGILLIVVLPNAVGVLDTAKDEGCAAYIKTVENQVQLYLLDTKSMPSIADLVDKGYIPQDTCPNGMILNVNDDGSVSAN